MWKREKASEPAREKERNDIVFVGRDMKLNNELCPIYGKLLEGKKL